MEGGGGHVAMRSTHVRAGSHRCSCGAWRVGHGEAVTSCCPPPPMSSMAPIICRPSSDSPSDESGACVPDPRVSQDRALWCSARGMQEASGAGDPQGTAGDGAGAGRWQHEYGSRTKVSIDAGERLAACIACRLSSLSMLHKSLCRESSDADFADNFTCGHLSPLHALSTSQSEFFS